MTRDEAIEKVDAAMSANTKGQIPDMIVDALIALDLLRVEEPRLTALDAAFQALHCDPAVVMTPYAWGCVQRALGKAGLTIVRKEDAK